MKHILLSIFIVISVFSLKAQVQNSNPDPNGKPWIIGGWREPTKAELEKIPQLKIDNKFKTRDLPSSLDNSTLPYFRPVFSQTDGCCAQASGIAYNFTYELNRERGTSANVAENQYPTHYTYNFLNQGSGSYGSWYGDGWNIIKANGCPTVAEYGGLAQDATYWMSGYSDYENAMKNRVVETFNIDVSTPEGLETLKYWLYNHADGSADGGIVNFAAGIGNDDYNITYDNIITKWGYTTNHAMTFVGWDDNISYDYNGDGQITNNIDLNGDGIVDMRDWERGAMLMVNSWGTYWGNDGKAYVMYRLLATPVLAGGIGASNMVSSVNVRSTYTKKMYMHVNMQHSDRSKIKIIAGVSTNLTATEPEQTISFPLFNYQGGSYDMRGTTSDPIEISLDITPLLSYINSNENAKFFLQVIESDPNSEATGIINSFSILDSLGTEYTCSQTNISIIDNGTTTLSVQGSANFNTPQITTNSLADGVQNQHYSSQLSASGGNAPYKWGVIYNYAEQNITSNFPNITSNKIITDDNDDGYGTQQIDFDFPFDGQNYSTLYLRTDGSICFEPGFDYLRSESAIKNAKTISVFASDLMMYPDDGDGIFYQGDANSATFRWKASIYDHQEQNVDVAITLYPSGKMEFYYGNDITSGLSWASGISAGDGVNYLISSFSGISDPTDKKIKIESDDFPMGMQMASNGIFNGTPSEYGTWNIKFYITDFDNITKVKTFPFNVTQSTDIEVVNSNFSIYPNPTSTSIFISLISSDNPTIVKIIDLNGKIIQKNVFSETNNIKLDVSNISSGIYLLSIENQNFTETKKLIIK